MVTLRGDELDSKRSIPRVIVLGGGYVAIWLARQLRRMVNRKELELLVIDKNNYHTFHGLVPEMLVGKIQAGQIISPARRLFSPGRFVCAEIKKVDIENKVIHIERVLDGKPASFDYDELVVGLGSVDNLTRYRGVGEHTLRLKGYFDCIRVRNHVLAMLEMAEIESDEVERRRLLHFVIAGGNYAGIEVAAELAEMMSSLCKREFKGIDHREVQISVVHSGSSILPELGRRFPHLSEHAEKVLRKRGVNLELGVRLNSATSLEAVLSDGRRIPARTIISCTGSSQSPLLDDMPFKRDSHGRLQAAATGLVDAERGVWTGGDCGSIPMKNGDSTPPLALYAMHAGKTVGKNIARKYQGKSLLPYKFTGFGDCCVLGKIDAVGQVWGVPLKGLPAFLAWRSCMILYLPSWIKRFRTIFDWMMVPILGRDIASVNAADEVGVARELYETDQVIIEQGDVGRAMYIIQSGKVEVVQQEGGNSEQLARLGPGEHFGEIAVLKDVRRTATVRALEPVAVLRISRDETRRLTETFKPFAELAGAARGEEVKEPVS